MIMFDEQREEMVVVDKKRKNEEKKLCLVNATQHNQKPSLEMWNELGVHFTNPEFTPWGVIAPQTNLRQEVKNSWSRIQEEWSHARAAGIIPNGLLIGGWGPICIPIASWTMAQALPPALAVAIQGPGAMVDGKRRPPVLAGWRVMPPQGIIIREGTPLPPKKQIFSLRNAIHCSARPLTDERKAVLEGFSSLSVINPCVPALPPLPFVDMEAYERQVVSFIESALENNAAIIIDGPPVETAVRVGLLSRTFGIKLLYVRTGDPIPGSIPPVVGIEELNWY